MSNVEVIAIDGYEFMFVAGDGVLIMPEKLNGEELSLDFLAALKKALNFYPSFYSMVCISEIIMFHGHKGAARHVLSKSAEDRQMFVDGLSKALDQDVKPLNDQERYDIKTFFDMYALVSSEREKKLRKKSMPRDGYVYLLKSQTGYYKIGRTKNADNRLKTFGVKLPFEVEYESVIQTSDMYQLEKELHDRFASKRVNGEWFNLAKNDVEYIKSLMGTNCNHVSSLRRKTPFGHADFSH